MLDEIDARAALDDYAAYLESAKSEWTKPDYLATMGGEVPVIYYEKPDPYSFKQPCRLYHSMLEKVIGFPARGMLWYQGESEAFSLSSYLYCKAMEALRAHLLCATGNEVYAFHFVQIAPWDEPAAQDWEGICNAQREFAVRHPACGMVTTGDCSGGADIHPPIKRPLGERLCGAACTLTYGLPEEEFTGPIALAARQEGSVLRVTFTHARGLRLAPDAELPEVEYADGSVRQEPAWVEGESLCVRCAENPAAVRLGWKAFYRIGLFNAAGIPASVFRLPCGGE